MISVLILTKNEAQDLPGCLASVSFSDDIHILDSESTDNTAAIAEAAGAHVAVRAFDGYARQRNAGLALPFQHPWVLVLDADERPSPELAAEMQQAVLNAPADVDAFRLRRHDFLWGRWLEHAQITPLYLRLFRVGHVRYTRDINEIAEVDGGIRDLAAPLNHFPSPRASRTGSQSTTAIRPAKRNFSSTAVPHPTPPSAMLCSPKTSTSVAAPRKRSSTGSQAARSSSGSA